MHAVTTNPYVLTTAPTIPLYQRRARPRRRQITDRAIPDGVPGLDRISRTESNSITARRVEARTLFV